MARDAEVIASSEDRRSDKRSMWTIGSVDMNPIYPVALRFRGLPTVADGAAQVVAPAPDPTGLPWLAWAD
ncbi:hypothetical protein GCM10023318_03280 [Nocardia callitridis]|uniref:Uncharacterized protein n=1 Tax=Nocardia callitridis TaxID=648753 RepID=A0ABP9JRP5_9NOCA